VKLDTILRKCCKCGYEAKTIEELNNFTKTKKRPYGRRTLCKKCHSENTLNYHRKNPVKHRYVLMISRCYNEKNTSYLNYGGRGITVCDEWLNNKDAFIKWAKESGFKPELTLDRIDNDGPYAPWNCRWVTPKKQAQNRHIPKPKKTNYEKRTRICSVCNIEKSFDEFYKLNSNPAGIRHICKPCHNERIKKYKEKKKFKSLKLPAGSY